MALLAGAGALLTAGAIVPKMFPETVKDDADKQADAATKDKGNKQAAKDIRAQNENRNPLQQFGDFVTGAGQEREEQSQRLETGEEKRYGFFGELAGGGQVSGPSGTDVIPPRLTDGEFVMSKVLLIPLAQDSWNLSMPWVVATIDLKSLMVQSMLLAVVRLETLLKALLRHLMNQSQDLR